MTNLVSIHPDVLLDILDHLSVPDLLNLFATNKEFKDTYYPYFFERINDHHQDHRDRKRISLIKQKKNFNDLTKIVESTRQANIIGIPKDLSRFMSLSHMPEMWENTFYTEELFRLWWLIYFCNQVGNIVSSQTQIPINEEIAQLTRLALGTIKKFNEIYRILANLCKLLTPYERLFITDQMRIQLAQEHRELGNLVAFLMKKYKHIV